MCQQKVFNKIQKSGKMKHSKLIKLLKTQMGFEPAQSQICKILDYTASKISARAQRDSSYSDEEIEKIERHYAISLRGDMPNNCIELDYFPNVFGSCGTGLIVFDESSEKINIDKNIIKNYSSNNTYSIISARGSSMSPVINDSDRLIVQKWEGEQIIDDNVYLFRYNDELFIKRLVKNIDQIICISENPRFEDRIIKDLKNFSIIGKIVGLFRERV